MQISVQELYNKCEKRQAAPFFRHKSEKTKSQERVEGKDPRFELKRLRGDSLVSKLVLVIEVFT